MTPDWPSLWKREPALRPARLTAHVGLWFWCDSDGEPVELIEYDGVSEALCRDAALRWLKAQGSVRTSGHACLFLSGNPIYGPGDTVTRYGGETWDAALVAACKAILDARG